MLFSCSSNEKSNGSNTKEVEILKKENELLKKQIEIDSLKHAFASDKLSLGACLHATKIETLAEH